jgi:hypothetical protein
VAEPAVDHRLAASSLACVLLHAALGASLPAGTHARLEGFVQVPLPSDYVGLWGAGL